MNQTISVRNLTLISICTSILCIIAPLSIPIGTVPISFATFIICINSYILGYKRAIISCFLYILLGIIGLPVFSNFNAGIGVIIGPTGGYIIGYIFLSLIVGLVSDYFNKNKFALLIGLFLGNIVVYSIGTVWLCKEINTSFYNALFIGVIPFIIGDIIKIIFVFFFAPLLYKRLYFIIKKFN